jgi:hypothetical protein
MRSLWQSSVTKNVSRGISLTLNVADHMFHSHLQDLLNGVRLCEQRFRGHVPEDKPLLDIAVATYTENFLWRQSFFIRYISIE